MPALTPEELIAARTTFGLTVDQFAAELGVTPHVYEAWEKGALAVPKLQRSIVVYRVAAAEREAALRESGLPNCAWIERFESQAEPEARNERVARYNALAAHVQSCWTCRAREQFVFDRFGPMPELPQPTWLRVLRGIANRIERFPSWARPVAWGGLTLGAMSVVRALFMLPAASKSGTSIMMPLAGILFAVLAGAFGGLVYSFVGQPLRRIRVVGPYLAGFVTALGYLTAIASAAAIADSSSLGETGASDVAIVIVMSAFLGAFLGRSVFRNVRRDE